MRIVGRRRLLNFPSAALLGLWLAVRPAAAEPDTTITRHQMVIGGQKLAYTAEAGRTPIRDVATGEPVGYVFYIAYRMPAAPGKVRPITFVWNGGPGYPTASLNFEGAGPEIVEAGAVVDNPDTWLTDSDLVFMDPVGVGFARAVSPEAQKAFTSIVGDVAATTEFVRSWTLLHEVEDAPLVIAGESYGAGRAGSVAYRLLERGFHVRGLALISNSQGLPRYPDENVIARAMHVGDYAVAALYDKKLPPELGTTPQAARAKAERWARDIYLPALRRLDRLSERERAALRTDLARHLGLKPSDIDAQTLSVTQSFFLGSLIPGHLAYYSDYRYAEPYTPPSLTAAVHYIRHELGYATDLPYLGVESLQDGFAPSGGYPPTVNASWIHSTVYGATPEQLAQANADFAKTGAIGMASYGPKLPGAAEAVLLSPKLEVLVAHGAYDPLGGCSIDAATARHLVSPYRQAITFRCYLSGHAIVRDAPARASFAQDMRILARRAAGD